MLDPQNVQFGQTLAFWLLVDHFYDSVYTEHRYDYLVVTKEAYEQGITPEMLAMLVETAVKLRED